VTELVGKAIKAVKEGDLEKKFENELEPKTQNHYYLDTCKKIMAENAETVIDRFLAQHKFTCTPTGGVPCVAIRESVRGSLIEAVSNLSSVGTSNTEQVIIISLY